MSPGVLPILTYHSLDQSGSVISVSPERFRQQMSVLKRLGFRGISLAEAVRHRDDQGTWPERTVVLTFDDGYENVYSHAGPTLRRHGFSATVFLVTGHVGGLNDWGVPPSGFGSQPMMDWAQALELRQAGWEIGAHTRTHPDLRRLSADRAELEIRTSRLEIEDHLGGPVPSFAYPFGYVSARAASVVEREFRAACLTELRRATGEDSLSLPRVDAYYLKRPEQLVRLVEGRLDGYLTLRRIGRRVRAAALG